MRLTVPRIEPADRCEELDAEQSAQHSQDLSGWSDLQYLPDPHACATGKQGVSCLGRIYILSDHNALPPRERELVILRTGFNWKSGYEWAQHVRIGKEAGLSDAEIARIKQGPEADGWTVIWTGRLLQAVDELTDDSFVTDATWSRLGGAFRQTAHGSGHDRWTIYPGFDDAEQLWCAAGRRTWNPIPILKPDRKPDYRSALITQS